MIMNTKFLDVTKKYGAPILNYTKAIGPFLISQSEVLSEKWATHKARLASVEAMKEVIVDECKMLHSVKEKALKRYLCSDDDLERVRLQSDIQHITESERVLNVGLQALPYFPEQNSKDNTGNKESADSVISDCWLDRFNEFAKLSNEPWREDLLARALAKEAESPGTVSPRALWVIGTLEEDIFHAFAALLNVSINVGGTLLIPDGSIAAIDNIIPGVALETDVGIGNLMYTLSDIGLVSDPRTTKTFSKGLVAYAEYGTEKHSIKCKDVDLYIKGIIYTPLGNSIASFYDANNIDLGYEILQGWIGSLHKINFEINKLS